MKKHALTFLIFICLVVVLVISLPKENKIKKYTSEEIELAIYINEKKLIQYQIKIVDIIMIEKNQVVQMEHISIGIVLRGVQ